MTRLGDLNLDYSCHKEVAKAFVEKLDPFFKVAKKRSEGTRDRSAVDLGC